MEKIKLKALMDLKLATGRTIKAGRTFVADLDEDDGRIGMWLRMKGGAELVSKPEPTLARATAPAPEPPAAEPEPPVEKADKDAEELNDGN